MCRTRKGRDAVSLKRSDACREDAKAYDAMCEGHPWIAISCATARATASVNATPHSSGNVDRELQFTTRQTESAAGRVFGCASCKPPSWASTQGSSAPDSTRSKVSCIWISNGRAGARLPPSVAGAPSLNAFMERLGTCWQTAFPDYT